MAKAIACDPGTCNRPLVNESGWAMDGRDFMRTALPLLGVTDVIINSGHHWSSILQPEHERYVEELFAAAAEGAIVTPSGLVYQELEAGSGASPTTDQVVKVDYHGTLHDGTVFDSSRDRGEPAEFKRTLRRLGSAAEGTSAPAPRVRTYTPQRLCT